MLVLGILPLLLVGDRVDAWVDRAVESSTSTAGVVGLVVVLLSLDTLLPVPSSVLATLAGARLGFLGAAATVTAGLCIGNALGYVIGRALAAPVVERFVGARELARAQELVTTRPGAAALAVTRPVPILSESVILLAGAARSPVLRTAVVCALANTGVAVAYAALGSNADGPLALPLLLVGSIGLPVAAALMVPAYLRRRIGRGAPQPAARNSKRLPNGSET